MRLLGFLMLRQSAASRASVAPARLVQRMRTSYSLDLRPLLELLQDVTESARARSYHSSKQVQKSS